MCGAERHSKDEMNVHKRTHTNARPFTCNMCPLTFRSRNMRIRHERRDHTGERPHQCKLCPMKFLGKGDLQQHLLKHTNERKHQCEKCLRSFKTATHLRRHKTIYSGSRNCITDGKSVRGCRKGDKKFLTDPPSVSQLMFMTG